MNGSLSLRQWDETDDLNEGRPQSAASQAEPSPDIRTRDNIGESSQAKQETNSTVQTARET